jgi:hypothetical protein
MRHGPRAEFEHPCQAKEIVVSLPPGAKHWHRADATIAMTHFAVQEELDGKTVQWMERGATATDSSEGRQR